MCGSDQGVCGVLSSGKSEGTYCIPYHTLLQACRTMAALFENSTTIIAWLAVFRCFGEEKMDVRQNQGVWGVGGGRGTEVEKVNKQILYLNIHCNKYAILWLLSLRRVRQ